jgi:hypothetical protein
MRRHGTSNVNLRIEHMVLEGVSFNRAEMVRLQSSMERELTELVRAHGLPQRGRAEASMTAGVRGLAPGRPGAAAQSPAHVGRELARSIYGCLDPAL